jgi:hypothetical protein
VLLKNLSEKVLTFLTIVILERKEDIKERLNKYYKPYSKKRMNELIALLRRYNIDTSNELQLKELINLTEDEKIRNSPVSGLTKPLGVISAAFVAVLGYLGKGVLEESSQIELIKIGSVSIALFVIISAIMYTLWPVLMWIIFRDAYKYEDLKNDIKQLIVFKTEKDK